MKIPEIKSTRAQSAKKAKRTGEAGGSSYISGKDNFSIVSIDNDTAGVIISSIDNSSKESGDNGSLSVKLRSRLFDNVTVYFDTHGVPHINAQNQKD